MKSLGIFSAFVLMVFFSFSTAGATEADRGPWAVPRALTGAEPLLCFQPPSNAPPVLSLDEPLGETYAAGTTWYDYQHNGTAGKMIGVSGDGYVHLVWMKGMDSQQALRHVYYNAWDPVTQEMVINDSLGGQINTSMRAGYISQAVSSDGFAFPGYHQIITGTEAFAAGAMDFLAHAGAFTTSEPDHLVEGGLNLQLVWPKIVMNGDSVLHMVSTENALTGNPIPYRFYYSRGLPDWDLGEISWQDVDAGEQFLQLGVAGNVSPDIATARGATRVAVAWTGFRPGGTPNAYNLDIFYRLSEDGGWTWGEDVNISQFALEDTHRVYSDASAIFDGRDYLHVAFTTHYFDESTLTTSLQTGRIWHWDEVRDTITVVGDNWEEGDALPGAWHLNACRPSLAVDSVTGYFYCSYLWFDVDSYSGNGYYNGEAWVSVSADSGLHWSVGRNVTETSPPSPCAPGDCRSERDITLAERVTHTGGNAYLNLEWILDLDPGGIPQNEGVATLNTVFFQRIPADSIPLEPLMPWYAFHFGQNIPDTGRCCYGDPEDPECDVTTAAECLALGGNWNTDLDCETPCPVFVCTCEDEPNTHCALTAVPIPDGLFAGVDIPIVVPVRYHITDLNVCFDVTHPAVSQLVLSLISPASTEILLFNHDAGGADFRCTVLDDQATTPIGQGSAPFNGSFQPNAPLSTLNGEIAEGNWILHISDGVWGSAGTLNWACLNFEYDYIDAATDAPVPVEYSLSAFPNPFNPATTLTFGIQQPGDVRIDVFNIAGQQVRELANRHYDVGVHALTLDGKDLPSGIYFAQLRAGSFVKTEKLVLMK